MNNKQAQHFLEKLFADLWSNPTPEKVDEFYHQDMKGYISGKEISIVDIKQRTIFSQKQYSKINTEIADVIAEGDRIAARLIQTTFSEDKAEKKVYEILVIYKLRDGKVCEMWSLSNPPLNNYPE